MAVKFFRLNNISKTCILLVLITIFASGCSKSTPVDEPSSENNSGTEVVESKNTDQVEDQGVSDSDLVKDQYLAVFNDYIDKVPAVTSETPADESTQKKIVNSMIKLVKQGGTPKEVHGMYLDGITQLSPEHADLFTTYAIAGLQSDFINGDFSDEIYQYGYDSDVYAAFWSEAEKYDGSFVMLNRNIGSIEDKKLQSLVSDAKSKGYYIASSEGSLYHMIDYTVFAKHRSYNTQAMADLMVILSIENIEPTYSDAALIVDLEVLAARAYGIEQMLQNYEGSEYEQYVALNYINLIQTLFYGVNNTPNFSYDTNRINESTIDIFKRVSSLENSYLGDVMNAFMNTLEENDGIYSDKIYEEGNKLIQKAYEKFNLSQEDQEAYWSWLSGSGLE